MKRKVLLFFLLVGVSIPLMAGDFPRIKGWKPVSDPLIYTADNLWEYINGAAEQFLSRKFHTARSCWLHLS